MRPPPTERTSAAQSSRHWTLWVSSAGMDSSVLSLKPSWFYCLWFPSGTQLATELLGEWCRASLSVPVGVARWCWSQKPLIGCLWQQEWGIPDSVTAVGVLVGQEEKEGGGAAGGDKEVMWCLTASFQNAKLKYLSVLFMHQLAASVLKQEVLAPPLVMGRPSFITSFH